MAEDTRTALGTRDIPNRSDGLVLLVARNETRVDPVGSVGRA